jgi:hypothetical protein
VIAMKSNLIVAVSIIAMVCGVAGRASGQGFAYAQKGKKGPPVLCSGSLAGFDGTYVKISQPATSVYYEAQEVAACTQTSLSPKELDITIDLAGGPNSDQAPLNPSNPSLCEYYGGYQNGTTPGGAALNTGSVGTSVPQKTKDVELLRYESENETANQKERETVDSPRTTGATGGCGDQSGRKNAMILDLTKCNGRQSDWITTLASGSPVRIPGTIGGISDGWVWMQRLGSKTAQRFSLSTVSMIGIGSCS